MDIPDATCLPAPQRDPQLRDLHRAERLGEQLGRELAKLRALLMEARAQAKDVPSARYHIEVAIRKVDDLALNPRSLGDEDESELSAGRDTAISMPSPMGPSDDAGEAASEGPTLAQ